MSAPENITNGSDTGKLGVGSWAAIVSEAVVNASGNMGKGLELSRNELVCMPTYSAVETLVGFGFNSFLNASAHGELRAPDGGVFDLNIPEACHEWVNVKCMGGSIAQGWGVIKSEAKSDREFMREALNSVSQMQASGAGCVLLIVSLVSGVLHNRLRESLFKSLTDEDEWE
jgi:hypothetical protein